MSENSRPVRRVVILGGGTAGWLTAAMLSSELDGIEISLVESTALGTVGVGEATVPPIKTLNAMVGLKEKPFIARTNATFKLGIRFEGWGDRDSDYFHAFGGLGKDQPFCPFHHFVLRARLAGRDVDLGDYSLNAQSAERNRFAPIKPHPDIPDVDYAYHFDAALYAAVLRELATGRGVRHIDALVQDVRQHPESGDVEALVLDNGQALEGDFFIDCSGFRALLIEKALGVGYIDWDHWLPCDRALAVQTGRRGNDIRPYTRSIARPGGWQWQIPLQNRTGNGLVYSSREYDDDKAEQVFRAGLDGELITDLNPIRFRVGLRERPWHKNVVALGLAGGFLEPLESTSIHLVQTAVLRLIWCFPHQGVSGFEAAEFNQQLRDEWEHVRDFIIAHYHLNRRGDSDLWRHCADMAIPDSLAQRIGLYRDTGKVLRDPEALFRIVSWVQVMEGQGVHPRQCHPIAANMSLDAVDQMLARIAQSVAGPLGAMPPHAEFLRMLG